MTEWSINPVGGAWFAAGVAAALGLLVLHNPKPTPSRGRLWTLRGLRLAATLMMAFALARPTLTLLRSDPLPASLLLLLDDSRSMSVEDSLRGGSRWGAARSMIDDASDSLRALGERWEVRGYRFSDRLSELPVEAGVPQTPATPTGEASAIGAALQELLEREGGRRLAGVVLMTDGAQRASGKRDTPPLTAARRLAAEGAPLYTFALGQPNTGDRADLAVEDLLVSDTVFAQTPVEVRGRLRVNGFANRSFSVQLLWENAEGEMTAVDAQRVTATPGAAAYPIRLRHTPSEPGEWKVSLRVATQEGELLTGNNVQSTFVTVREGGVKVLQMVGAQRVGGQPGAEQRFVRASLAASPDVAVTRRVVDYRRELIDLTAELRAAPPDVYLLDNLDARALSANTWMAIAEQVREGAGLMMTGGHHSFGPGGFRDNPLGGVLPVGLGPAERQRFGEPLRRGVHLEGPLGLAPTRLGERSPLLRIAPESNGGGVDDLWPRLPPLDGANRFDPSLLKPNARVLLEAGDGGPNDRGRPLLVAGEAGAGRTLAFAGDSTWRWVMRGFGDAHRRFWRRAVLWLARKDDRGDNPVAIELSARRVPRGATLEFSATAKPDADQPPDGLRLEATVKGPGGERVALPLPRGGAVAGVFAATDEPGDYALTVTATSGGAEIGAATARFLVPDTDPELDNPAAEPALLAQMAAATAEAGGRPLAPEELPELLAALAAAPPETSEEVTARITHWDTWPFFLTLVILLGVEWWLRKRWGLV